jgi:hypothetical protein
MPVIITGNNSGHRQLVFDLTNTGAYALPAAQLPTGRPLKIGHIFVSGTTGAGDGTIVIRSDSASGPIVWQLEAVVAAATRFVVDVSFNREEAPVTRGLYIDAIGTAWGAKSTLILYTT